MSSIISSMNITVSDDRSWGRTSRDTAGGRRLHYDLQVIQQPERARACGSGPKSSADRRPIDPPPIVQLRVYEGETFESGRDITFDYNATFFLYVSLENARPIAHGRVHTPAATSPPVLTGMPVSGCAYLDRPDPAGYFLFPDLSVRHEGYYKLSFELYEQRKERRDFDAPNPTEKPEDLDNGEYFCHLLGIKSQAFTVWSAKKFPGLAESTPLSRTIAEQGCRVRIRREIRMRRRENKGGAANGDQFGERRDEEFNRPRRTQSPGDVYRARSASNSSVDRRRISGVEFNAPAPPPPIAAGQPPRSMLSFGQGAYGSYPPPPAPLSNPVSPAHPPYSRGRGPSLAPLAPASTASHPCPARPPSAHDDRRPSYAFSSASSHGLPLYPRASHSSSSTTSLPPLDVGCAHKMVTVKSPVLSPRSSIASPGSGHSLFKSTKRALDDGERDETKPMFYKRAAGNHTFKELNIYGGIDGYQAASSPSEDDYMKEEEYSRKRSRTSS